MQSDYHDPVLVQACIEGLNLHPGGIYVDATFGGGGHSRAIAERLGPQGRLIAFDRDADAWANAGDIADLHAQGRGPRFDMVKADYRWLKNHLRFLEAMPVDGILADLGVSSHQFDTGARGFSFRNDGPLDMRMDRRAKRTAADLIAELDVQALTDLLRTYGEVDGAHRVARQLVKARSEKRIDTTGGIMEALKPVTPRHKESGFLAQVFQAFRIAVNDELGSLEAFLRQTAEVTAAGARLVVISYHSLEDRMVKQWMRTGDPQGHEQKDIRGNVLRPFNPSSSKAVRPTEREIMDNPRARSARLRIAERI